MAVCNFSSNTYGGGGIGEFGRGGPNGGRRIWPNCLVNPYSYVQARLRNSRAKDGSWYTDLIDRFWSSKNRIECTPWTTGVRTWAFHSIVAAWRTAFYDLVAIDRIELRSRLLPNVVPSPKALHITGVAFDDIISTTRPSHYQMVCEIQRTLQAWSPAMFLGFNSINFDEEFLRQAFYCGLHPIFLTNTNGNARADVLKLVRAVATLHPNVLTAPRDKAGRLVFRLGKLASTNGMVVGQAHDALADVEITLALCRKARDGAPDLWSTFLRFAAKAAVLDFVRDEEAFAYFEFFGGRQPPEYLSRAFESATGADFSIATHLWGSRRAQ
jgi:hypothetical protein